jgi:hypothetical protein
MEFVRFFPKSDKVRHPVKQIFNAPLTYEFAEPVGGTYPLWYDPTYWQEGIEPYFDLRGELRAIAIALIVYGQLFLSPFAQLNISIGFFALFAIAPRPSVCLKRSLADWPLAIPVAAALILYSFVHAEHRFVAAFVSILWLVMFSGARLPGCDGTRRMIPAVVISITVTTLVLAIWSTAIDVRSVTPEYSQAAKALNAVGVSSGSKIGIIWKEEWNREAAQGALVPRLAKVQVIAEVSEPDAFWATTPSVRSQVIEALANAGVTAILTERPPPQFLSEMRWEKLGNTGYYVFMLPKKADRPVNPAIDHPAYLFSGCPMSEASRQSRGSVPPSCRYASVLARFPIARSLVSLRAASNLVAEFSTQFGRHRFLA